MDPAQHPTPISSPIEARSLTTPMAWLSICLLVAAWGPQLTQSSRLAWTWFGLLGLVAALGLEAIARMRRATREQSRQQTVAVVQERRLVTIERQSRSVESLRDAIRWLSDAARKHGHGHDLPAEESWEFADRRTEERTSCWMPVGLLPRVHHHDENAEPSEVPAFIRNVSPAGIRLCHSQPMGTSEAVLRVTPDDVEGLALLITRCWTRPTSDGWHQSGWKLLAVLSEVEDDATPMLAASIA